MKNFINRKIQTNLKFYFSLIYYNSLICYISPDLFSFCRSGRFCQKILIVKSSNVNPGKSLLKYCITVPSNPIHCMMYPSCLFAIVL